MYRLIIADDEEIVLHGLIKNINWDEYGFHVLDYASDGQRTVDLVERHHPELLITDIMMPSMNGIEVLKRVRIVSPETQVIILSAYDSFDFAQQAIVYDVAGYLIKPIRKEELDSVMRKVQKNMTARRGGHLQQNASVHAEEKDTVEKARLYIQEHYCEKLTLDLVASKLYISPELLSRNFKKRTGYSFVDYIVMLRINKAKQLLLSSYLHIKDIASQVGYDDHTYFCKVFKRETQMTPLEYRCSGKLGDRS